MLDTEIAKMKLLQPIKIKNMVIKNRVVMPGMGTLFGNPDNTVSDRLKGYIEARAKGGVGLIIVEYTAIVPGGRAAVMELGIWDDRFIKGLKELVEIAHSYDAKIGIQLHHAGRGTTSSKCGRKPVAPSAIMGSSGELAEELSIEEIQELVKRYGEAAKRAKDAGFDCVEIHGAHGYLISQFLSPAANQRTDQYGGSVEGRLKFPIEVIKSVRKAVGDDYPIFFRINAEDMVNDGRTINDTIKEAPILVKAGIDTLNVSIGMLESSNWIITPGKPEYGFNADNTEAIKKVVDVPVIAVGKIHSPEIAEEILVKNKADMVALGRALLADPEFVNKVKDNNWQSIRHCIHCLNGCYSEPVTCTQNPDLGHEWEYRYMPTGLAKNVIVVGGGPGGLEAALILARRCHQVTIYEKNSKLGGQVDCADKPPYKCDFENIIEYRKRELEARGVNIIVGKEVTLEDIKRMNVDAVVIATGSIPIVPPIEGINSNKVVFFDEILQGKVQAGENIIIVGGGSVGIETAHYLFKKDKQITVVEMLPEVAKDVPFAEKVVLMDEIEGKVKILTDSKVLEITDEKLIVEKNNKKKELTGFDQIVIAIGSKPDNTLYKEIKERMPELEVYIIGDAKKARKIIHAIAEGNRIGRTI